MNVEHLRLFLRIVHTRNISQAGSELGLSAAVASAQVSKLEADLGVRLFHRTTRRVALTEDGLAFLPHAEDVVASVEAAKASVGAGNLRPSGTLRVAAPASFARMHLVPSLPTFLSAYEHLNIDLKLSDTIVDLVEGGFDIAIRNSALSDSSLIARKLAPDRRVLCASPEYLRNYGSPESPGDLKNHNCITLPGLENWQFSGSERTVQLKAQGNFRTDNGEALRDACVSGLGISISSTWSIYKHLVSGTLQTVLDDYPLVQSTNIWAVYPSSRQLAPKVRAFIDHLLAIFGDKPYWDAECDSVLSRLDND